MIVNEISLVIQNIISLVILQENKENYNSKREDLEGKDQ
jgi:hypothetical protein